VLGQPEGMKAIKTYSASHMQNRETSKHESKVKLEN
jgi:hypothetical protein